MINRFFDFLKKKKPLPILWSKMVITFITYFKSSLKKFIDSMDVMEPH